MSRSLAVVVLVAVAALGGCGQSKQARCLKAIPSNAVLLRQVQTGSGFGATPKTQAQIAGDILAVRISRCAGLRG